MPINLDKLEEYSRITSESDEFKITSDEEKYLVGTSLHPQRICSDDILSQTRNLVSDWLILSKQSHYAISISQQSSSQRYNSDITHGSCHLLVQRI